jgi:hypothetical protein
MWDPKRNGVVHETGDILWMRRMFHEQNIGQDIAVLPPMSMIPGGIEDPTPEEGSLVTLALQVY